jgi:hypothetical protein
MCGAVCAGWHTGSTLKRVNHNVRIVAPILHFLLYICVDDCAAAAKYYAQQLLLSVGCCSKNKGAYV